MAGRNVRGQGLSSSAETNLRANTPTAGRVLGTPPHLEGCILRKRQATVEGDALRPANKTLKKASWNLHNRTESASRPQSSESQTGAGGRAPASRESSQTFGPPSVPSDVVGDELGSAGSRTPPRVHRRAVPNRDQGLFKPRRTPASSSDAGFERPGPVIDPFIGSEGLSDYEARVGVGNIERASTIEFGPDFSVSSRAKRAHGSGDRHRGAGGAS
ncbi:MAG: hypothetical protein FRX48_05194 [Lasallia pustulata]|uniref:Uncharacterized protein n=1 Tax=Lasallia pustulata TaxID=136370 RepID=A0A5M8PPM8_9LECA|nr:MAG: hypothetical protein FRX48_05194 [Lasallia pustulata]